MPESDFNKVVKQLYLNHTLACVFSCRFVAYFRTPFLKNTSGRLVLQFISERDVTAGVPHGSTDEPLLFNLFINDLVFFIAQSKLSNYAHDLFVSGGDIELTTSLLCSDFKTVESWFFLESIRFSIRGNAILYVSAKMLQIQSYLTLMTKF